MDYPNILNIYFPSLSRVPVPDERFDYLCDFYKPARYPWFCLNFYAHFRIPKLIVFLWFYSKVPAYLNIVDIAGLVKGAHEGQGLGNAFLSHIRSVDAIFHLCRKYKNNIDSFLCSLYV